MPVRGDVVDIVRGRNIGRRGVFIKNVGLASCTVLMENGTPPQRFLRASVANAMVADAPPTPIATAVVLGGASPAGQQQEEQEERRTTRAEDIENLLDELLDGMNAIYSLEQKLRDLLLRDGR
jgi:hypothetical protein